MAIGSVVKSLDTFARFTSRLVLDNGRNMTLEPFQRQMLEPFFAGVRETTAVIAKGSGKSCLLAALSLYELLSDPTCEGCVVASSRDQAGLLLRQLQGFVVRTPGLQTRIRLKQREAVNPRTGGRFRVMASDVDTLDGIYASYIVADELHRQRSAERYAILLAAVQKRNGRLFGISTAGVMGEGLLWDMRERALALGATRNGSYLGLRTDRFAWCEWSLPDDADYRDLAAVKAANPAPWVTRELLEERYESPSSTPIDWRRFSCNQWVQRAELETVIDPGAWHKLARKNTTPIDPVALSVDASLDRQSAAVGICAFIDSAGEVPFVDCAEHGQGIAWTLDAVLKLSERHEVVGCAVDPGGPAARA